jgi:hypothetical protein
MRLARNVAPLGEKEEEKTKKKNACRRIGGKTRRKEASRKTKT